MSDPRIWSVFRAGLYDNGELIDEIAVSPYRSHAAHQHKMVEFSAYIEALQEIGRANAKAESLTSENTRLRALLRVVAEEDLDADAADGVTVLQVVIKEARDLLAIKEKIE